jgi:6,7-dimethyl-8-ribityllumazine synthase
MPAVDEPRLDATGRTFAVVVSRFNLSITRRLLDAALDGLKRYGCDGGDIEVFWVPGSFELPIVAQKLARSGRFDVVICLGAVIRSDTPHFDFVAAETARGISRVGLDTGVPVTFGVLTTDNVDQAVARAGGRAGNRGWDAALNAIEMAALMAELS